MDTAPTPDTDRLIIFDTTLRDGEQSPGISLDQGEKLEIAEQLARLGVDVIEAGFPIASQGDFESVQAIAKGVSGPIICGLSRTAAGDVDRCWEAIEPAARRRIHVFIATSETHMKHKLRMTPDQVKAEAAAGVARARGYTEDVEFSPEDASRSDFEFMCEVLQIAVDNGATTLNIPDTVGFGIPEEYAKRLHDVRSRVSGDYVISTHCHNDLGLAVANSLAARPQRRPPDRVRHQRPGRARRQRRPRRGRHGRAHPRRLLRRNRLRHPLRGAGPHQPTGEPAHRLPGPVQQGRRGPQRLRPRVGHPPARRAERAHHLRDHGPRVGGSG